MKKRGWEIPDREATSEDVYMNRRRFMKAAGATGIGAVGLLAGCGSEAIFTPAETPEVTPVPTPDTSTPTTPTPTTGPLYPAKVNPEFKALDRALTKESVAGSYNIFMNSALERLR